MQHDTAKDLHGEVCILVATMSQENPVACSGTSLESWKNNFEFMQTP